jgi:hypothetical protein
VVGLSLLMLQSHETCDRHSQRHAITVVPKAPSNGTQLVAYVRPLQAHELEETTNELRRTLRRLGGRLKMLSV